MDRISPSRRRLNYYNEELQYFREMAELFAKEHPKVAGRLGLDAFECADPYVERLLEGAAFLTSRVRMKLDDEFPHFTQNLLETIYPHYLCPTPSMSIVQFEPDGNEPSLNEGVTIPKGSVLRSGGGIGDVMSCQYRTAYDLDLWPAELTRAIYYTREISAQSLPELPNVSAGVQLRVRTTAGQMFSDTLLDRLSVHVRGGGDIGARIYEALFAHATAMVIRPAGERVPWQEVMPLDSLRQVGFSDDEALLPYGPRSFQGYRLLHEYFHFPQRFMFFEIAGLRDYIGSIQSNEMDIFILFNHADAQLENELDRGNFRLHCVPAINLFPMELDRINVSDKSAEFHAVPDRTRPLDFEIYEVNRVVGYGNRMDDTESFDPFYASRGFDTRARAFFATYRTQRVMSQREIDHGARTTYNGSEVYFSLVDPDFAPFRTDLRQLAVHATCTNRDLPILLHPGTGATDFVLDINAPVQAVRIVGSVSPPRPSLAEGPHSWRLINHLSLNYLSLMDTENGQAAAALRELLSLYGDVSEPTIRKQIASLRGVSSKPIVRRVFGAGQIAFARGVEIALTFDDDAVEGAGAFLLSAVLDRFFAKYVSVNSFTETVVRTEERGEFKRWPARMGQRKLV